MQVGERIRQARKHRGITQRELGLKAGFPEKSADTRIAQYEIGARVPKKGVRDKIAEVLDINPRYLYDSDIYSVEDIMFTLFEIDEHYFLHLAPGKDDGQKVVKMNVQYVPLNNLLEGWMKKKQEYLNDKISKDEYMEWKLHWPDSAEE